jgi:hypothetical protein
MARNTSRKKTKGGSAAKQRVKQKLRQKAKKTAEGGSGVQWMNLPSDFDSKDGFYEPKVGINRLSILPYEVTVDDHPEGVQPGDIWYERTVGVHYDVGGSGKSLPCPRSFGKKCPLCEHASGLWDEGDEDGARELFPSKRQIFNVLHNGEVKLWTISHHCFGKKLETEIHFDDEGEYAGFFFLEKDEGYDLKVRMVQETYGKNKYLMTDKIDFLSRKKDLSEELYDQVLDLDTLVECPDSDYLRKLCFETEDEDTGEEPEEETAEEEPEEKPAKRKPRSKKKKPEPEEEPEDLECPIGVTFGDDFDEYEDCDSCEIRKQCKAASEGEEPEPEEEEEEETPAPKKKPKKKPEKKTSKKSSGDCPHGHEFGTDCDDYDECDDCEKWEECCELQEKLKSGK